MDDEQKKLEEAVSFIKQLDFGEVVITVHDSEIVQIEKSEKKRFNTQKRLRGQS
ncbi:MAG: YezD family protein [Candidatus Omnitrophota bacterium]